MTQNAVSWDLVTFTEEYLMKNFIFCAINVALNVIDTESIILNLLSIISFKCARHNHLCCPMMGEISLETYPHKTYLFMTCKLIVL